MRTNRMARCLALVGMLLGLPTISSAQDVTHEPRGSALVLDGKVFSGPAALETSGSTAAMTVDKLPPGTSFVVTMIEVTYNVTQAALPNSHPGWAPTVQIRKAGDGPTVFYPSSTSPTGPSLTARYDLSAGVPFQVGGHIAVPTHGGPQALQFRVHGHLSVSADQQVANAAREARRLFLDALKKVAPEWVTGAVDQAARKTVEEWLTKAIRDAVEQRAPGGAQEEKR